MQIQNLPDDNDDISTQQTPYNQSPSQANSFHRRLDASTHNSQKYEFSPQQTLNHQAPDQEDAKLAYQNFKKENKNLFESRNTKKNILIASIVFSVVSIVAIVATCGVLSNPNLNFLFALIPLPIAVNLLCLGNYSIAKKKLQRKKNEFSETRLKISQSQSPKTIISHTITTSGHQVVDPQNTNETPTQTPPHTSILGQTDDTKSSKTEGEPLGIIMQQGAPINTFNFTELGETSRGVRVGEGRRLGSSVVSVAYGADPAK